MKIFIWGLWFVITSLFYTFMTMQTDVGIGSPWMAVGTIAMCYLGCYFMPRWFVIMIRELWPKRTSAKSDSPPPATNLASKLITGRFCAVFLFIMCFSLILSLGYNIYIPNSSQKQTASETEAAYQEGYQAGAQEVSPSPDESYDSGFEDGFIHGDSTSYVAGFFDGWEVGIDDSTAYKQTGIRPSRPSRMPED